RGSGLRPAEVLVRPIGSPVPATATLLHCDNSPGPVATRAHLDTASAGPRTVPVRSSIAGVKAPEFSRPPRPRDVLRAGTARAPVEVSSCACAKVESRGLSAPKPGALARLLLNWFKQNARDLPWRRTRDPYAICISEVMLQQTQV